MPKAVLAIAMSAIATGAVAENVTLYTEDKEMLERVAPLGISQAEWSLDEYGSMFYVDAHRLSEHARIKPSTNSRTFEQPDKSLVCPRL